MSPIVDGELTSGPSQEQEPRDAVASTQGTTTEEGECLVVGAELSEDLFSTGRERMRLSRSEKRAARRQYSTELGEADAPEAVPSHALDIPAEYGVPNESKSHYHGSLLFTGFYLLYQTSYLRIRSLT